jgi:hypothetical protein
MRQGSGFGVQVEQVAGLKTSRMGNRVLVYNKLTGCYEIYDCGYMLVIHIVDFDAW